MLNSRKEAYLLLDRFNAPKHLKTHVKLVGEVADLLIHQLKELNLKIDYEFIRTGVAIHDIGKIIHPLEMSGPGSAHEPEGEQILLKRGISAKLARVSMSHARWQKMKCSTEELIIALSDNLWKGKRVEALEIIVIDRIAALLDVGRWDVFPDLDFTFEAIAAGSHERLLRSINRL